MASDRVPLGSCQVNAILRSTIEVAAAAGKDEIERLALADPKVAEFAGGKPPKKVIVVPGKIVNIVAAPA